MEDVVEALGCRETLLVDKVLIVVDRDEQAEGAAQEEEVLDWEADLQG